MANEDKTPYVEDVDNDCLSLSTHSIDSMTEPIDLRTPDGSEINIHRQDFIALTAEMHQGSQAVQSLLREMINASREQHQYTSNALNDIANQIGHQYSQSQWH